MNDNRKNEELQHDDYTIAWVCALPSEMAAAKAMLDETHPALLTPKSDHNTYVLGRLGTHNIVIVCLPPGGYGTTPAAWGTAKMLYTFKSIRFGLLVGIGGGVPSKETDIRLGDVVVSEPTGDIGGVVQYDLGKATGQGSLERTGMLNRPPQILLTAMAKLRAVQKLESNRIPDLLSNLVATYPDAAAEFMYPGQDQDKLYDSVYDHPTSYNTCDGCESSRIVERPVRQIVGPSIHYGLIASGNQVMKHAGTRDKLAEELGIICFEMEAAGLMNYFPCLVIRGISDYADSHKNPQWQGYAAAAAAAYAKELLLVINANEVMDTPAVQLDVMTNEDRHCLADLLLTDPSAEKIRIERTKGGLLTDSFQWILDNSEFKQWRRAERSQLLWIKGDPGKGKTMLMIGIIDELSREISERSSATGGLSYYLCQGTDSRLNNATAVLRGLIYGLVMQQPFLISHLRKKYDHAGRKLYEDTGAFYSLFQVFTQMLQDTRLKAAYLLVDGLDECEVDQSQLLDLITQTVSIQSSCIKWIVSSRNHNEIEQRLGPNNLHTRLSLELNAEHISHAVDVYVDYKVSQLVVIKHNCTLQDQVRYKLRQKSDGTFLWVALVIEELQKVFVGADMLVVLDEIPSGLMPFYDRMMKQIKALQDRSRDSRRCILTLSTAATAYRPLHLEEIHVIAGLQEDIPDIADLERIINMCGSFLTIRKNIVYFIHQSAKDYLTTIAQTTIFPDRRGFVHHNIFSESLRALRKTLRKDIYNIEDSGIIAGDVVPDPDPLLPVRYSCEFWADHFCEINQQSSQGLSHENELSDDGAIFSFLKEHFLHWLESLSLIHKLSDGLISIRKLSHNVQYECSHLHSSYSSTHQCEPDSSPEIAKFLKDAEKFVLSYRSIIEQAPLQTYGAALAFSPRKSRVKNLFWRERLSFIGNVAGIREEWDPCLQTLEGHGDMVHTVTFSPDGKTLASGSFDGTVIIWNAMTGASKLVLEGHSQPIRAVSFSPDGKLLASASYDTTVGLWDTMTGVRKSMLSGHHHKVLSVAFSCDNQLLASSSSDNTIRLWDVTTGNCMRTLVGHTNSVRSVTFSRGNVLASASSDHTVRLWDVKNGTCNQTLEGHAQTVRAVAFSPDDNVLVSASDDKTVRFWHVATGANIRILDTRRVLSLAFSPNGRVLALGTSDKDAQIWHFKTGTFKQRFLGHNNWVHGVAFSPDGNMLASTSSDRTVRLWDTKAAVWERTIDSVGGSMAAAIEPPTLSNTATRFSPISADERYPKGKRRSSLRHFGSLGTDTQSLTCDIGIDGEWVTLGGQELLWLPPDSRAVCSAFLHSNSLLILGHASGEITFLELALS